MIDQEKIHNQCFSEDPKERIEGLKQLKDNFSLLLDDQQAWIDLIILISDNDNYVRFRAASSLVSACSQVRDKQQVWDDLHILTNNEDPNVRSCIVEALVSAFPHIPDKQQVWNDLIRLTIDEDCSVKLKAAYILESAFPHVPDKQQAWDDIIKLTDNEDCDVRYRATDTLGFVFSHVPDKKQGWNELIKLTTNEDLHVRDRASSVIGSVFSQVPDKQQAWNDLHGLTADQDDFVRAFASKAICHAFSHIPDKQQAWNDLIELSIDECTDVNIYAANALGSVFPQVLDKQQAWDDLIKLTTCEDGYFGLYTYHTLGRISIFNACQVETEEDCKKELEKAIEFFEKEIQVLRSGWELGDPGFENPSEFCLPFYRSFHAIIFKENETEEQVNRYLTEAKRAIRDSNNKKTLYEAIKNLASALTEVQNLDFIDKKEKLNSCRKYCEIATELMKDTEKTAPYTTELIKKGLPILDRKLKTVLDEIQEKAKNACKDSKGTDAEEIALSVNRKVQKWEISSQKEMTQMIENLAYILEEKISVQPKNQYILSKIEQMKCEKNLVYQYEILAQIIPLIRNVTVVPVEPVIEKIENLEEKLDTKFKEMIVSLKPRPKGELVISKGLNIAGSGAQVVVTIPLTEINYPELPRDLEEIKGKFIKVPELPSKLFNKIRGRLP